MVSSSNYCNSIFEPRDCSAFETNHPNPTGNNSLPTYDEIITESIVNNLPTICSTSTTELPSYSEAMEQMFKNIQNKQNDQN